MPKVDLTDCVKQIIAINKELDDHDSRQDGFVYFLEQLNTRIERLEQRANAEHYGKGNIQRKRVRYGRVSQGSYRRA